MAIRRPAPGSPGPVLEAVIFDLDGVLTDTATLHRAAWQRLFDELFVQYPSTAAFTEADYLRYVDGRRRTDGVAAVLTSRGIELPAGDAASSNNHPERETMSGLAGRKDEYYLALLHHWGPRSFPSSIALLRALRHHGVATAVVSGSRNCAEVLAAAGLAQLLDVRVDGLDAERLNLAGKPDPATFLEAARRLGVAPASAAVIEDAVAGVEAGSRGGFAVVIGVDRHSQPVGLSHAGAGIVVADLAELAVEPAGPGLVRLVQRTGLVSSGVQAAPPTEEWNWSYDGVDPITRVYARRCAL